MTVQKILYVSPHADDETLSMICSIRAELREGHEVHTLLLTTGENSGIRSQYPDLTRDEFVAARDDEFVRACRRVGPPYGNIHIGWADGSDRPEDGELSAGDAAQMIGEYLDELGAGTWVKTLTNRTYPGRHADHIATGQGALALLQAGGIVTNGLRFFVEPYGLTAFKAANPGVNVGVVGPGNDIGVIRAAADQYRWKDSVGGMYGIGWASVDEYFQALYAAPASYYHVP